MPGKNAISVFPNSFLDAVSPGFHVASSIVDVTALPLYDLSLRGDAAALASHDALSAFDATALGLHDDA